MPAWMYGVTAIALVLSAIIFAVGLKLTLRPVPAYDVVIEAEDVARVAWKKAEVQE